MSVLGDIGSRGYRGSKPKSIRGSNNLNNSPNDSPKAIRVGTLRVGTPLLNYTLIDYTTGTSIIRILILIRYYLSIVVATSIEFSRLLLKALSFKNDTKGVVFKYYNKSNSYTILIALLRYLL